MSFHQVIVVISSASFVVGGLLLGIAVHLSAMKQTRERLERIERLGAMFAAGEIVSRDAVA